MSNRTVSANPGDNAILESYLGISRNCNAAFRYFATHNPITPRMKRSNFEFLPAQSQQSRGRNFGEEILTFLFHNLSGVVPDCPIYFKFQKMSVLQLPFNRSIFFAKTFNVESPHRSRGKQINSFNFVEVLQRTTDQII